MITIQRQGDGMQPRLHCSICRKPLPLRDTWVGFPALERHLARVEGRWMHRDCGSGRIAELFDSPRLVLWRAEAVLSALLHD